MRFIILGLVLIFILVSGVAGYLIFGQTMNAPNMVAVDDQLTPEDIPQTESMNSREVLEVMFAAGDASFTDDKYGTVLDMKSEGDKRIIMANGLPDHETGTFPNDRNPHTIREQAYMFTMPVEPVVQNDITPLGNYPFGIAMNGVVFDPNTAEFYNNDPSSGWRLEALSPNVNLGLDESNAHVGPNGAYHYHGIPHAVISEGQDATHSVLVGYAADGFPIFARFGYSDPENPTSEVRELASSYKIKDNNRASEPGGPHSGEYVEDYEYIKGAGDLDECNGRFTVTPLHPEGTYAYFLTNDFPFIPRCFKGVPDESFLR